jgi:hypothetical protein
VIEKGIRWIFKKSGIAGMAGHYLKLAFFDNLNKPFCVAFLVTSNKFSLHTNKPYLTPKPKNS